MKLQIAHQMRTAPHTQRAKAIVDAGEIGPIQEVRVRGKEDRRAGGEDMMVLGSHLFDMMRYFLGDPRWVVSHVTTDGEEMTAKHVRKPTEPDWTDRRQSDQCDVRIRQRRTRILCFSRN